MIVEDPHKGVCVPEISEYVVNDAIEVQKLIIQGNSRRMMAATGILIIIYNKLRTKSIFFTFTCYFTD